MKSLILLTAILSFNISIFAQTDFEYYNIAVVKYNMRDYKGALTDLTKAIEINSENNAAFILRGSSSYNLEDFHKAIDDYTRAIEIISGKSAGIKLTITDQRGNIIEPRSSLKTDPDLAIPYYNRALARTAIENYNEAIDDYSRAIENDPDMLNAYYNRGHIKYKTNDKKGACSDWETANELGLEKAYEAIIELCTDIE
jgi:tetratricopeptide (TPR) repeat protein